MARLERFSLAHHVHWVQVSVTPPLVMAHTMEDLQELWSLWRTHAQAQAVAVHAYRFDAQHMTALLSPMDSQSVGMLMQSLGRQYVQRFNRRYQRVGTLWSARYRCVLIEPERWMLPLMTWMGSLQSGGVDPPRQASIELSSEKHYAGMHQDALITPHPEVWRLGNTPFAREAAYTEMVRQGLSASDVSLMKGALHAGWPLGSPEFVANLQKETHRRLGPAKRGRPRKNPLP